MKTLYSRATLFVLALGFFSFSALAAPPRHGHGHGHGHPQEHTFNTLRSRATKIDDLSSFLRSYIGDCRGHGPAAHECQRRAEHFRKRAGGNHVFVALGDAVSLDIRPLRGAEFSIGWVPFFSAYGYGLSAQAPTRWTGSGHPIYTHKQLREHLPHGTHLDEIIRWNKTGRLAAEVIVAPRGTWKAGRGKSSMEGMQVTWKAIRIFDSRSGQTLGIWVN